jgi:hypothetical protein
MLCCSTALYKNMEHSCRTIRTVREFREPSGSVSVCDSQLLCLLVPPLQEVPDVVRTKLLLRLSVNYRFPIFYPGLGEHSGNHGWLCSGEEVCSMCADTDCSSTTVYTAISNVRPRTLIFPLCVVLTCTSDTHTCMYNSNWPLSQLAANLQQTFTPRS